MAGISASSPLLRVSATVRSLIPLRTLRAVDGTGSPCPTADLRGSADKRPPWVVSGPSPRRIKVAGLRRMEAIR
jgi:hypothetical protein